MHGIDLHDNETKETLKKFNLHRKIDLIVGNLSYGQQKKLELVSGELLTSNQSDAISPSRELI